MTPRHLRRLLRAIGASLLLASAACVAWAVIWPCRVEPVVTGPSRVGRTEPLSTSPVSHPPLASFEAIVDRSFQKPLYDPSAPVRHVAAPQATPPPQVTLLATFLEEQGNQAMFSIPSGEIQILGMGDTLEVGKSIAEVVQIQQNQVVLKHLDELFTVELKP